MQDHINWQLCLPTCGMKDFTKFPTPQQIASHQVRKQWHRKMSTRAQRSVSLDAGTISKKKTLKRSQNVDRRKWSLMFSRNNLSNIEKWWRELQEAYILVLTRFWNVWQISKFHKFLPTKNDFREDFAICRRANSYVMKDSKRYSLSLPPTWVCSESNTRSIAD